MAPTLWPELDTPCLRVDLEGLERNLEEMAALAAQHGAALRPHIKSHKMVEIARKQLALGAIGLTTAKLSEAEVMCVAGLKDLFICYPLVGEIKLRRLRDLAREARIMTIIDSREGALGLSQAMSGEEKPLDVLMKLDVGMHRVGVPADNALDLAGVVSSLPGIRLRGVCIHEGSVYGKVDPAERAATAREQVGSMLGVVAALRGAGHDIDIVSSGSTPGALATLQVEGITEIRPGNYVFNDAIQVALGVAGLEQCALSIVTTVVSHSASDRAVVDAGSKAFSSDRGGHGLSMTNGFGIIRGRPGILIEKLSEEHGWLSLAEGESVEIGERLDVVPNHACPVANNFEWAAVTRGDEVVDRWQVEARGCMT